MKITQEVADGFDAMCKEVGLAVLMGQKVQFSLSYYYAVALGRSQKWTSVEYQAMVDRHLNRPMGTVVSAIAKDAPLSAATAAKVEAFRVERNWLVHDFDQEATPILSKGQGFHEYAARMRAITKAAYELMQDLDSIGNALVPGNGA